MHAQNERFNDLCAITATRVLGLCQYLILNGPVIGDGDVVGNTVEEKLRVIHAQGTRLPVPVLKISAGTEGT